MSEQENPNNAEAEEDVASETQDETSTTGLLTKGHMDVMFQNLESGFASLPNLRDLTGAADAAGQKGQLAGRSSHNSVVTINFIDPNSGRTTKYPNQKVPMDLFEKLTSTFEAEFGSTLRNVPYQNVRSGRNAVIERLPVRPVLTRSHGGSGASGNAMVPWGGTAGSAAAPVSDPAEWHNGPYCHVYIAACENMQHYRSKVRPSLQAFVSQIEGAANNAHPLDASGAPQTASGNYSAHYIIVFVPTGPRSADAVMDSTSTANRMGAALASRMAAAKKRMASAASRETQVPGDSTHSQASSDNNDMDDHSEMGVSTMGISMMGTSMMGTSVNSASGEIVMSRQDKDLFRKFTSDFPNGTTCLLSTLLNTDVDESDAKYTVQRVQEWNLFNRALGNAIVDGFKDRCRRYHEELRRLDSHRAQMHRPQSANKKEQTPAQTFDLSHFFLVKESLSFTYEQMQLPAEALLQYQELRAFVPDADEAGSIVKQRKQSASQSSSEGSPAIDLAVAGDTQGFRRRIRAVTDMVPIAHIVMTYLFSREISLLSKMAEPIELIKRCQSYIKTLYSFMLKGIDDVSEEESRQHRIAAERAALIFCWDVKCACQSYFTLFRQWMKASASTIAGRSSHKRISFVAEYGDEGPKALLIEQALARELNEMLEFARLRLMRLGDIEMDGENPIRIQRKGVPDDLKEKWSTWSPPSETIDQSNDGSSFNMFSAMENVRRPFTNEEFGSDSAFVSKYMELTSAIATTGLFAGRRRQGARLEGEIAEILIHRGDYQAAIKALIPTVGVLAKDHWHRCHFWYLFRLASCQRRVGKPAEYLKTLVNCFGPNIKQVAPQNALNVLLTDLEAVADFSKISGSRFGMVPFLGTRIEVEKTSAGESTTALGPERRQYQKKLCIVGDTVRVILHVSSYLPRPIELNSVSVFVMKFDRFAPKMEENSPLKEEEIFKALSLSNPSPLNPGINTFSFEWVPVKPGQFILASSELSWKGTFFNFDSLEIRRPIVGIQVVPSKPTQSIKVEPLHLVPGHVQPVRIVYRSGDDVIQKGTVRLKCSEGLELIKPGENADSGDWKESCEVPLPTCPPGEETVMDVTVRPSKTSSSLKVEIETFYRHLKAVEAEQINGTTESATGSDVDVNDDDLADKCMKTVLDKSVPTLDKEIFSVEETTAVPFSEDGVLINILLLCNSPVPFSLKEWQLCVPPPLTISEEGDLNSNLFNTPMSEGEELSFGFICKINKVTGEEEDGKINQPVDASLKIQLQDEVGSTFSETLQLDLNAFYAQTMRTPSMSGTQSVMIELKKYLTEGCVGAPVTLTYVIENSPLLQLKEDMLSENPQDLDFFYSVDFDENDWLVGGSVKGIVDLSTSPDFSLELIALPTREGVINGFPTISLSCGKQGRQLPISVQMQQPETFNSLAFCDHTAVACPTAGIQHK